MKVVLLVLVALIGVVSGARPVAPTLSGNDFSLQIAVTCYNTFSFACSSLNGTCASTKTGNDTLIYVCPSGTYSKYGVGGVCTCTTYNAITPVLGANCTAGDDTYKISGSTLTCGQKKNAAGAVTDSQYYWFNTKLEGDRCSGEFDCTPPSRCSSGTCRGALLTRELCYDGTSLPVINLISKCSVQDYCNITANIGYCAARLSAGASCVDLESCPNYLSCTANPGETQKICQVQKRYFIAAGQKANETQTFFDCESGTWSNNTAQICLDYDTIYAQWQSSYNGISCTDTEGCGTYGTCQCVGSNPVGICQWSKSTPAQLRSAYESVTASNKKYYDAGCSTLVNIPVTEDTDYCTVRLGLWTERDNTSPCNASSHGMMVSSITIIIATLVAMIAPRW